MTVQNTKSKSLSLSRKLERKEMELLKPHIQKIITQDFKEREEKIELRRIPIDKLKKSKILRKEVAGLGLDADNSMPSIWVSALARYLYKKPFDFGNGKKGVFTINKDKFTKKINKELRLGYFEKLTIHEKQFFGKQMQQND